MLPVTLFNLPCPLPLVLACPANMPPLITILIKAILDVLGHAADGAYGEGFETLQARFGPQNRQLAVTCLLSCFCTQAFDRDRERAKPLAWPPASTTAAIVWVVMTPPVIGVCTAPLIVPPVSCPLITGAVCRGGIGVVAAM